MMTDEAPEHVHPLGKAINNVKNNGPELLAELAT